MLRYLGWTAILAALLTVSVAHAAIEVESVLKSQVGSAPILDVTTNPEENLIFLLTREAVLIYSAADQAVLERIALNEPYDHIAYLDGDQLVLTAADGAVLNIVRFNRIYAIDVSGRAAKGPADAKVTLVVFDDYQCPYCSRLEKFVGQLLSQFPNDVKYVIKHYPLSSHTYAHKGAMAALAAGKQGKFWEFHSQLLENYNKVNEEKIIEVASGLGLDMEKFSKDRNASDSLELIREDLENARAVGVSGTPSVFLNGKRVPNRDLGKLPELIRRELGR